MSEEKRRLSRREFLQDAGLIVGGVSAASLLGTVSQAVAATADTNEIPANVKAIPPVAPPAEWDYETDVVVVGTGGSGGAATVAALQAGAKVITLEKNSIWGGHIQFSMAWMSKDPLESPEESYAEQLTLPNPYAAQDPRICSKIAHNLEDNIRWIQEDVGVKVVTDALNLPPITRVPVDPTYTEPEDPTLFELDWYQWFPYCGRGYAGGLRATAEELGAKVLYSTAAVSLVTSEGAVVGVKAQQADGTTIHVKGQTVVLCTGGYSANKDMLSHYLVPDTYAGFHKYAGMPSATGDGIRMAQGAGAGLSSMDKCEIWHGGVLDDKYPNGPKSFYHAANQLARTPSLSVNMLGERYCDEFRLIGDVYGYLGQQRVSQLGGVSFTIFDSTQITAAAIMEKFHPVVCVIPCPWFEEDFADQVERGIILKADTLEELAELMGVDPETLRNTTDRYNALCAAGYDEDFFKAPPFLQPILTGPFYAAKEVGGQLINTWGGVRCDDSMRVLDEERRPIPGLYAAGETVTYCAEINRIIPTGRMAGTNAATEALKQ